MLPPIEPALLSTNPKFNALYSDLCNNKLNPDGTSKLEAKAQRDHDTMKQIPTQLQDFNLFCGLPRLCQAREDLHKVRIEAAKRDLIKSGLQDLSYRADELPEELRQLVANVAALLEGQITEEDRYLLQEDLMRFQDNIKHVNTALSHKFEQDVKALATIADPDNPPSAANLTSSINKLKDSISNSESTLAESRLSLAREVAKLHELYRQVIEESIRILEQTIHGSVARGAKAKADYLAVVAEGMNKKLNVQHAQLLSQLYSPDFQEALELKFDKLQGGNRSAKRKVSEAEKTLGEYSKIKGMGSLAQEYAEVLKETEKVKGDIARLEKAKE